MRSDRLRSLGEMATGIAHELNQPLVGVRGLAEHLLIARDRGWDLGEEAVQRKLSAIVEQADRMTHIIEHVRIFAREAGRDEAKSMEVNEVVKSAAELLEAQYRARGLELRLELGEGLPAVSGNPYSLEEVVLNLLTNARDAMEEGKETGSRPGLAWVLVRTGVGGKGVNSPVRIEVIDNGAGIPRHILPRIFEPFFTTKSSERGTGLGLAISRTIVKQVGGRIECASKVGKGTTVTVSLPAI